jgi:hypothetical protein
MTRVTNHLRDHMERQIMKDLPSREYTKEIHALVQELVIVHAAKEVRVLYDDPDMRGHLHRSGIDVKVGNSYVPLHRGSTDDQRCDEVYGLKAGRLTIRMDDAENASRLPEGSIYRDIVTKLHKSGLVAAYFAQEELRVSVRNRVRANLAAAKTFKQLYEILEPELHHYIPKDEVKAQVPACVAPVVDDLRKLGAVLPSVPKVEEN